MKATTRKYFGSITLRFDTKELEKIDEDVTNKKFEDRSDAIRTRYELGKQTESLIAIRQDPEKRQEFESQLDKILKTDTIEHVLDGFDEDTLRTIRLLADQKLNSKVKQEILNLSKY